MHKKAVFRSILLGGSILGAISTPAFAQSTPDQPSEVDEIVVTGSRLSATAATQAAQPVQVVTAQSIEAQGVTQVADLLDRIPALQSSTSSAQANGGAATLNLRGMGAERTLTLVNGRRYVAGVPGSAAVDVSSIPAGLIERVEVLTGGASAVYGSDAVTGVVNFILKDDYEGTEMTVQGGLSGEGDAEEFYISLLHGRNFDNGRGNFTIGVQGNERSELYYGDRSYSKNNGTYDDYTNPALFFQVGDPLPPGRTLAQTRGRTILVGGAPRYAGTDASLITRAQTATPRAFIADPRFSISSTSGLIGIDLDGDGYADPAGFFSNPQVNADCNTNRNGQLGYGCYTVDPVTGQLRPFQDGLYAGSSNQSGGDGAAQVFDNQSLLPKESSYSVSFTANYNLSTFFNPFVEINASWNKGTTFSPYNTYDDSIPISLDNPFIPAALRALVNAEIAADPSVAGTAQIALSRDHIDIFDPKTVSDRRTYRAVVGTRGELDLGWNYELSFNYGRTERDTTYAVRLEDRFFAALDAVTDPVTGQAVCRSTLDPTAAPPISGLYPEFGGPVPNPFQTFTPGAGSDCRPLNLFGLGNVSPEASAFVGPLATDTSLIQQTVVSGFLAGDLSRWFSLPGGPISFALGGEYRKEQSDFNPNDYDEQGVTFRYATTAAVSGEFEVSEGFVEISFPLLADLPFAETLTLNAAARFGDYTNIGNTETFKADLVWAPVTDVRFRAGVAKAVRAPNIGELFTPLQTAGFRPIDPCSAENITQGTSSREANCRADLARYGVTVGSTYDFEDPLTAQFFGAAGGNPDLQAETSDSWTAGVVLQPRFIPNFTLTADYWNIKIENAIASVSAQDIVNSCYDAPSIANQYCALLSRDDRPGSLTQGGLDYLQQSQVNFAGLEASGVDFNAVYRLDLGAFGKSEWGSLALGVGGTWLEDRNDFPFVADATLANPVKEQLNSPEWVVNTSVRWSVGDFTAGLFSNYQSKQTRSGVEIENTVSFDAPWNDPIWTHDASLSWDIDGKSDLILGVNNLTDEEPFLSTVATPVSARGRYFFVRFNKKL